MINIKPRMINEHDNKKLYIRLHGVRVSTRKKTLKHTNQFVLFLVDVLGFKISRNICKYCFDDKASNFDVSNLE